jgi:hypothetical protein
MDSPNFFYFFYPEDKYVGRFGIEGQLGKWGFTVHFFPRLIEWGYHSAFGMKVLNIGPLLEVVINDAEYEA